ncbi:unnamed protein product [Ceratitis capitata]|uniref:(Mediterranean fruit fly) hypothetical protein n=1 Tax=Ceratitis capitata TaxID=7213 RepID=A0A811U631_CERCA|nr:unnamed protein product [Ceratitis capitata]
MLPAAAEADEAVAAVMANIRFSYYMLHNASLTTSRHQQMSQRRFTAKQLLHITTTILHPSSSSPIGFQTHYICYSRLCGISGRPLCIAALVGNYFKLLSTNALRCVALRCIAATPVALHCCTHNHKLPFILGACDDFDGKTDDMQAEKKYKIKKRNKSQRK